MSRPARNRLLATAILLGTLACVALTIQRTDPPADAFSVPTHFHQQPRLMNASVTADSPVHWVAGLDSDQLANELRRMPGVDSVEVAVRSSNPRFRIIHILDWHFVSKDDFAIDLIDLHEANIPEPQLDQRYNEFLLQVEGVQNAQRSMLLHLIEFCGLDAVYQEGLTTDDMPIYDAEVRSLREMQDDFAALRRDRKLLESESPDSAEQLTLMKIDDVLHQNRLDLLRIGAAGQLSMERRLKVLPLEDSESYTQANPISSNATIEFDEKLMSSRRSAIVRRLLADSGVKVIVLGGAHDLTEAITTVSD